MGCQTALTSGDDAASWPQKSHPILTIVRCRLAINSDFVEPNPLLKVCPALDRTTPLPQFSFPLSRSQRQKQNDSCVPPYLWPVPIDFASHSLVMKYLARGVPVYFSPITRAKSSTELRGRWFTTRCWAFPAALR